MRKSSDVLRKEEGEEEEGEEGEGGGRGRRKGRRKRIEYSSITNANLSKNTLEEYPRSLLKRRIVIKTRQQQRKETILIEKYTRGTH